MSKNIAKILAVVSTTTAVGVMPLLGQNLYSVALSNVEKGNGIIDVLYSEYVTGINSVGVENINITPVAETEETTEEENVEETKEINIKNTVFISGQNGFKSYMSYELINSHSSNQYKVQLLAYTGDYGIRMIDGRYCIAVGTALNASVGDYIDLVLNNGTVISCIVGDIKDNRHTLSDNITTAANGCVSEFIIDDNSLSSIIKRSGSVSKVNDSWDSAVVEFVIYDFNVLETE